MAEPTLARQSSSNPMAGMLRRSCRSSPGFWLGQSIILLAVLFLVLFTFDSRVTGVALHGTDWYRAAVGWRELAAGVDTAFLGDQKVMQEWLTQHKGAQETVDISAKRGIVVPAGGANQMANAFANLFVLRHHLKCKLPITISYWGSTEPMHPATLEFFKTQIPNLDFMDLSKVPYPTHHRWLAPPDPSARFNGFKVKIFALYAAPYEQVLLIDSDSMPLLDPAGMFDDTAFKRHGNLFWPDRWCTPVRLFKHLGMSDGNGEVAQADSGQLYVDRSRHSVVLDWLLFLNTHDEFTYRYAHGDKDTFRAAFHLAGQGSSYYQVPQPLSVALAPGFLYPTPRGFIQHHTNGSLAFIHRTSKAKYTSHETADRAFSFVLLQPSCHWSERHWHFFTPLASVRGHRVMHPSKCNFSLYDPPAAVRRCRKRPPRESQQPPVLEVADGSYVELAQTAADFAQAAFRAHVQLNPEVYPQKGGSSTGTTVLVFAFLAGLAASLVAWLRCWRPRNHATMAGAATKTLKVLKFLE